METNEKSNLVLKGIKKINEELDDIDQSINKKHAKVDYQLRELNDLLKDTMEKYYTITKNLS